MLKLIIEDDEGRKTVVPFVRDEITIGRQEGNTIRLTERNVSRRHARLMRQNGHVVIEDLGSYNGIKVNGDRIKGQVPLGEGDLVQIGDYDLAVQAETLESANPTVPLATAAQRPSGPQRSVSRPDMAATVPAMPTAEPPSAAEEDVQEAPTAANEADTDLPPLARHQSTAVIRMDQVMEKSRSVVELDATEAPKLVVMNTDFAGKEFVCGRSEVRVGRTDDNDVAIDHRSLSRTHCKVVREDNGEWRVIDMQSANGLLVNGEPYAQVTLRSGDVIELGHVKIKFLGPGEEYRPTTGRPATADTMETDRPVASSKAPVVAVLIAALVVVGGLGGYLVWKQGQGTDAPRGTTPPRTPTPTPTPTVTPEVPAQNPTAVAPPDTPPPGPSAEQQIAEAEAAIHALDWLKAESILTNTRIGDALHPKAKQLLAAMSTERGYKLAIEQAQAALTAGDHVKAAEQLSSAQDTRLLKDVWARLDAERAALFRKSLDAAQKAPAPTPTPAAGTPSEGVSEAARPLLDDARALSKEGNYRGALFKLLECVKRDPKAYDCYKFMGIVYAKAGDGPSGVKAYEQFLKLAPPDHKDYEKVKKSVEDFRTKTGK